MSFLASVIESDLEFMVDDANSSRYSFADDFVHAINASIQHVVALLEAAFVDDLLSPTILSELITFAPLSFTSEEGTARITITATYDNIWRIVGVDPEPIMDSGDFYKYQASTTPWAKFVPYNEWGSMVEDPFAAGYPNTPSDLVRHVYTRVYKDGQAGNILLLLKPVPVNAAERAMVVFLANPGIVAAAANAILLPLSLQKLISNKAYTYLMRQAGPEAAQNIQISEKEVQELVSIFNK